MPSKHLERNRRSRTMKAKWLVGALIFLVGVLGTSTAFLMWRMQQQRSFNSPWNGPDRPMRSERMPRSPAERLSPEQREQMRSLMEDFRRRTEPVHMQLQKDQQALYRAWKSGDRQATDSVLKVIADQRLDIAQEAFATLDSASQFLSRQQQEVMFRRILNLGGGRPGGPPPPPR
jgi:Spy/CpxP family protein refolding chaperone